MSEVAVGTLADFLLARIAEDEAAANAATSGPWGTWAGHRHSYERAGTLWGDDRRCRRHLHLSS